MKSSLSVQFLDDWEVFQTYSKAEARESGYSGEGWYIVEGHLPAAMKLDLLLGPYNSRSSAYQEKAKIDVSRAAYRRSLRKPA